MRVYRFKVVRISVTLVNVGLDKLTAQHLERVVLDRDRRPFPGKGDIQGLPESALFNSQRRFNRCRHRGHGETGRMKDDARGRYTERRASVGERRAARVAG